MQNDINSVDIDQNQSKILEIAPIGKGKRFLLFWADYFLSFILCFVLYNIAVVPLGYVFSQYDKKSDVSSTYEDMKLDILYGNDLLFYHDEDDIHVFSYSLNYTFDCFLSYYCLDEETSPNVNYPQYGHKIANDVIWTYFNNVKNDSSAYDSFFDLYNDDGYFIKVSNDYVLASPYKEELAPYFTSGSDISTNAENYYDDIGQNLFLNLYGEVIDDISINDITYSGIDLSYNEADVYVTEFETFYKNFFAYTSIITFAISWLIYFLLIPLFRKKHQTIGMSIMKVQRINVHRLKLFLKRESALSSFYPFLSNASMCFFMPMTIVGATFPFALSTLIVTFVLSVLFQIVSVVFLLFNSYNRTLTDLCSQSVCVTTENLDAIYSIEDYNNY